MANTLLLIAAGFEAPIFDCSETILMQADMLLVMVVDSVIGQIVRLMEEFEN